ncbi:MAG TPA: glycosyltransferase family 4 protein [Syntrophobacteraceae bacterium]|nr:glycosyltransferase family 4 protein [Syntrophobacteraceae bacterium]
MKLGSLDTFLLENGFWQDKMGKPVVNQEFLYALLQYGTLESYHIFCPDTNSRARFQMQIQKLLPPELRNRLKISLSASFFNHLENTLVDFMHQGDFTYHMPYLIELRNRVGLPLPVSGVTHSLDGALMQTRFIQLLLAGPRSCDCIVCSSNCARDLLTRAFSTIREGFAESFGGSLPAPPEMVQIPLGISDRAFQTGDSRQCRNELGIPAHHCIMLSLARFSPRQKMDLSPLLEMIQWLSRQGKLSPFTLILAGGGKSTDLELAHSMVERLQLQDCVRIEGNVPQEKKTALFSAADIFISLTDNYQETFGLTILEAMAHGLPVIASDFSGYKELVEDGLTGFLIPSYSSMNQSPWDLTMGLLDPSSARFYLAQKIAVDMSVLAEAIVELASNPEKRLEMGIRARVRAMRCHWQAVIPRYEELWRELKQRAMAARLDLRAAKSPVFLTPQIKTIYAGYPTAWLEGGMQVALTPYGRDRYNERFQPILYEDLSAFMDNACSEYLLLMSAKEPTLEELTVNAASFFGYSREAVMFHVDWLMKHGYIAPVGEEAP